MENLFLKEIINWLKETIDEGYRNLTYEYDEDENELLIKSKDEELPTNVTISGIGCEYLTVVSNCEWSFRTPLKYFFIDFSVIDEEALSWLLSEIYAAISEDPSFYYDLYCD